VRTAFFHLLILVGLTCVAPLAVAADEGPVRVTFGALLRGPADLPADAGAVELLARVPEEVGRLNGREVMLTGYLVPKSMEDGRIREGVIARAPDTCGPGHAHDHTISPAERVVIRSATPGIAAPTHVPVTVRGMLRVSPERQYGVLIGYYVIENAELVSPTN
jgi:hypothetical protein